MRRRWALLLTIVLILPESASAPSDTTLQAAVLKARGDGLPVLTLLQQVAEKRAPQIATDFSHYGPGADAARAPLAQWTWGEILAWNNYPDDLTVDEAIQQWEHSPEHAVVLFGRWAGFGAAVAVSPNGAHYFVVIFGSPPKPSPPRRIVTQRVAAPEPTPAPTPVPVPTDYYPYVRYADRMTPA